MRGLLLSLSLFASILLSINGQDNKNISETSSLVNEQGEKCECVPYYLCDTPKPAIDLAYVADDPCDDYLQVCCEPQYQINNLTSSPNVVSKSPGCGIRNPDGVGFRINIKNESKAQFGEFPWMVAVLLEKSVEGSTEKLLSYQCGAALIHPQVVLTSAHCVNSEDKKFSIRAGEWDSKHEFEILPHQNRQVKNIIIHPDFNAKILHNDLALLILETPLEITENVDTVCLPPQNKVLENVTYFYTSWEKYSFEREGILDNILNSELLPLIQHHDCQERLRRTRLGNKFILDKSFLCVQRGDTCKASGGSPLVCSITGIANKYYLSGMSAWGIGCVDTPLVLANVAVFRNWIDNEMSKLKYDKSTYAY